MRRFLILLIVLLTATSAHAALNAWLTIIAPFDTVMIDGEASVIDSVIGDGNLLPTAAVDAAKLRDAGLAGSIINAIVFVPGDLHEVDALIINGEPERFRKAAKLRLGGRTPVLIETPAGLSLYSINQAAPIGHGGYVAVIEYPMTDFDVDGLILDGDAQPGHVLDESDYRNGNFAGSVVFLQANDEVQFDALVTEDSKLPLTPRGHLPNPEGTYVGLIGADGVLIVEVDR